jgi:hypothetical protein
VFRLFDPHISALLEYLVRKPRCSRKGRDAVGTKGILEGLGRIERDVGRKGILLAIP